MNSKFKAQNSKLQLKIKKYKEIKFERLYRKFLLLLLLTYVTVFNIGTPFVYAEQNEQVLSASDSADLEVTPFITDTPINTQELAEQLESDSKSAEEEIEKIKTVVSHDEKTIDLSETDAALQSASFFKAAVIQKIKRKTYRLNEKIQVTVFNARDSHVDVLVKSTEGKEIPVQVTEELSGSTKYLSIVPPSSVAPGKYTLEVTDSSGVTSTQDFTWGVLAINPNKSVYKSGETARLAMAVLNERGHMVCDADVVLSITAPDGVEKKFSTKEKSIIVNPECQMKKYTERPDFEADFTVSDEGIYPIVLSATTNNGTYSITDSFEVDNSNQFDIEREVPTRIYPLSPYPVSITVTANEDFKGIVTDVVPSSFQIAENNKATMYKKVASESDRVLVEDVLGASTSQLSMPFKGERKMTAGFGEVHNDPKIQAKYEANGVEGHDGVDFDMPVGTDVFSVDDGKIVRARENDDYGTTITIQHDWGKSYYGHLSELKVKEGNTVRRGELIGLSGNTGLSTDPHLHFGIKLKNNDKQNGYYGKIDPLPYLGLKEAKDVLSLSTMSESSVKVVTWEVDIKKGEKIQLGYTFDAPDDSPQFYTLGPLRFFDTSEKMVYSENRRWQIASDAPATSVKTVEFFAGQYDGSATSQNDNQKQEFVDQTYVLSETSADIIDAYVEVNAQIGSAGSRTYNSARIYFDSCTPACTPSTTEFVATGNLGTSSGESQTIRFRAQVSSETDLAAYTGGGASRTFRVGYCFATGANCSGTTAARVQAASAKLVLTYSYDFTSSTQTNTVYYPLESSSGVGSRTAAQAACTMDTNCPTFSYNADIPELTTQRSQFFQVQTLLNANGATDHQLTPQVDGNASGAVHYFEEGLTDNGGWIYYLVDGLAGYANSTSQNLELGTNASNVYALGGENVVTYSYSDAAATRTKTVVYPVGEVQTAGSTTKSSLVGPTVYFPETGVTIKKAWFRVHTELGGNTTAANLVLTTKVGDNGESGNTSYSLAGETQGVSDDGYFIHMVPSSDYTELDNATATDGKTVQMSADWSAARGPVSGELVITYTYTGDSDGFMTITQYFAGQMTAAPDTSFTTSTGAIDPSFPEGTAAVSIRGASLVLNRKDASATSNATLGSDLTTSTCTASNSSTTFTDTEITSTMLWKDYTGTVTDNDSTTYTACYSSSQNGVFNGVLTIVYQVDTRPLLTQIHSRWRNDNGSETGATWRRLEDVSATAPIVGNNVRRIRVEISNEGPDTGAGITYRLEYGIKSTTCSAIGSWIAIPVTATTEDVQLFASTHFTDGAATTNISGGLTDENSTFVAGEIKDTGNQTSGITLTSSDFTEIEYAIQVTSNATIGDEYCFRLTNAGSTTNFVYSQYPELTIGEPDMDQNHYRFRNDDGGEGGVTGQSITLHPTGQGNYTTFTTTGCTNDTDEWDCVNDQTSNAGTGTPVASDQNTTTIQINGDSTARSSFTLDDSTILPASNITQLVITGMVRETTASGTNPQFRWFYRLNGVDTDCGSTSTVSGTTFASRSCTFSSLNLSATDLDNLEIGVAMTNAFDLTVTQVYVDVTYDVTGASWKAAEDTALIGQNLNENVRLRFAIANTGDVAANRNFRIEYASKNGASCGDDETFAAIPVSATSEPFDMTTSAQFPDGVATTTQLTATGSFAAGNMREDPNNSSGALNVGAAEYTEIEYNFQARGTAAGAYCFRVSDNGTDLDTYTRYPELVIPMLSQIMRHGKWFYNNSEQPFRF